MKTKTLLLASSALLIVAGCAPQTRTIGYVTATRTVERLSVATDGELRVGFFIGTLRDDCSSMGQVSVKATTEPANGRLNIRPSTEVPHLIARRGTEKAKCLGRPYPGMLVTYKPNKGFAGEDSFGIDVIWPTGVSTNRNISVQVR